MNKSELIIVRGPELRLGKHCGPILRGLPQWFGREDANERYIRAIDELPTFTAYVAGELVGFLTLKRHNDYAAELYVLAVDARFHRRRCGSALIAEAETYLRQQGVEYLQVKTLGPSHPDRNYESTRRFYVAMGFRPLEEFKTLWDKDNPCLLMVKALV
jgi:ribosomal protein S18 acetylase RimI-like enzyme